MHLTLTVKRYHEFFWLRDIQMVNIQACCAECFIGHKQGHVYWDTLRKSHVVVDTAVNEHPHAKAYYLCGLSAGYNYNQNTHVAFVPAPGENIYIDNPNINLVITDARRVDFEQYVPQPVGYFSQRQRTCRNWIFANYIKDGLLGEQKGGEQYEIPGF